MSLEKQEKVLRFLEQITKSNSDSASTLIQNTSGQRDSNHNIWDTQILTLSTFSITASLVFLGFSQENFINNYLLMLAYAGFWLTIVSNVVGFYFSDRAHSISISKLTFSKKYFTNELINIRAQIIFLQNHDEKTPCQRIF